MMRAVEQGQLMAEFFAGVAEARAFLDAQVRTPERRRHRLEGIARELLRPRPTGVLLRWLASALADALEARAWQAWLHHDHWQLVDGVGELDCELDVTRLEGLDLGRPARFDGQSVLLGLPGSVALHGGVWLVGATAVDDETERIVTAIAATAGMLLEQSLQVPISDHQS